MKPHEKIELATIPMIVVGVYFASQSFSIRVDLGWAFALAALVLLVQGFFRDLYLLYRQRMVGNAVPRKRVKCMCLESTLGMVGIAFGILLTILAPDASIPVSPTAWAGLSGVVMLFGFATKDVIISWKPMGIRREPDHVNTVFTLK